MANKQYLITSVNDKKPTNGNVSINEFSGDYNDLTNKPLLYNYVKTVEDETVEFGIDSDGLYLVTMPKKGDMIRMELGNDTPLAGMQNIYRVLSINWNKAYVVAMYDPIMPRQLGSTQKYANSTLDIYLNETFYNSLNDTAKAAIVPQTITQYTYSSSKSVFDTKTHASYADYTTKTTYASIGSRYIYAPDVDDLEVYFNSTFSKEDFYTLLWNTTTRPSKATSPWTRSVVTDTAENMWITSALSGYVSTTSCWSDGYTARPVFTVDLSKIDFEITTPITEDKPESEYSAIYTGEVQTNGYKVPTGIQVIGNTSGLNVGTYTAVYKPYEGFAWNDGTTDAVQSTFTINKADGSITAPTAKPLAFNNKSNELVNAGLSTTGTVMYKLNDGIYSELIPTAKDLGTYTVYFYSRGDSNHNDTPEGSVDVQIRELAKGDLISMSLGNETPVAGMQNTYRVLKLNNTEAFVMAMYDQYNSISFESTTQAYSGSDLDICLNETFYNSLNDTAKAAIIQQNITQYKYYYEDSTDTHASYADYSTKAVYASVGNRYVYALDVEDIENYFDGTFGIYDIFKLFWNATNRPSTPTYPWLRSASANYSEYLWDVSGYSGKIWQAPNNDYCDARPAFVIDLSKVDFNLAE